MAMIIYNNVPSLTGQRFVGVSNSNLAKSLEKLSSGLRINHASDDASGLAISEKLRGQISGLKRASMNAQDGISMLQTAEGAMGEVQSILQRMRELSVQASNGIYTTNDRKYIQDEVDQLKAEINRISSSTEFNTKKLLNGDATALWSTDKSDKLSAIIRSKVAEGNYNINLDVVNPGSNYVYKSDVMTLNEGALGAMIDT
ncbi:MAG: flagellin, partial [Calditerrivibrio sp.]|nr:flagellin [Calditerrivibrio sp.]